MSWRVLLAVPLVVLACGTDGGESRGGGTGAGTAGSSSGASGAGVGGAGATGGSVGGAAAEAGVGGSGAGISGAAGVAGASGDGGVGGVGVGGGPGDCAGKPGAPGLSNRQVNAGGLPRTFLVHVPSNLDPNSAAPVVFAHHGFTMSGEIMRTLTDFQKVADENGFVVVLPDGAGTTWNAGVGVCGAGALGSGSSDDFAFVEAMLGSVEADQCVDRKRVFTTGFSMGGYFSNHIACKRPDLVRGVAPHSGGGPPAGCLPGPKPVMIVHGTADALITFNCGTQSRDHWVQHNGCSADFDAKPVQGGTCEWSRNCPPGGQVVLCRLDGMGHGWAGHVGGIYGGGTQFEDATRLVWSFFAAQ